MYDIIEIFRAQQNNAAVLTLSVEGASPVDVPTSWSIMRLTHWLTLELRDTCSIPCVLQRRKVNGRLYWVTQDGKFHCHAFELSFQAGEDFPWAFKFGPETVT